MQIKMSIREVKAVMVILNHTVMGDDVSGKGISKVEMIELTQRLMEDLQEEEDVMTDDDFINALDLEGAEELRGTLLLADWEAQEK